MTEGYRYNERNELTERIKAGSLTAYRYDKNGSIISEEEEGRKSEYRYDLLNRQTYVKTLDGREQENFYDGEGLRAGVTENGKRTTFLYHNGEIFAECDGDSAPIKRYVRGNGLSYAQTEDGTYHAYHQDEQGSTAYVTRQGVENCYQYDAFGNLTGKKEAIENRILYTGQQYDQETGQYYLRARYYSPVVGRFLQEDSYRGDGLNLYAYCANNPVVYYDPSGHGANPQPGCGTGSNKELVEVPGAGARNSKPIISDESKVKWGKGTFDTVEDSLNYHYGEHGKEVGASDIDQYVRKADGFGQNLRGAKKSRPTDGTPGAIRYTKNGKYIIMGPDGKILSFGKER